jgi:SAM-dependent MidA family methyltransferase
MSDALYGPDGFYRRELPGDHFRTSATASPLLAETLVPLVVTTDEALGRPARLDVVDVGTGDGGLLANLVVALPDELRSRVRATAVEVRPRPSGLAARISWTEAVPAHIVGIVLAHEYLDNVALDVIELDAHGQLRQVVVDPTDGTEELGPVATDDQAAWVAAWWPLADPGDRAEVGISRDHAWVHLLNHLERGLTVAVDYGHQLDERRSGHFSAGTLTGYRDGHQVVPIPDGSCDITAHVAMDACAAAGIGAGVIASALVPQARALRELGLTGRRPPLELAHSDPPAYVAALSRAMQAAELLDPSGLGAFWWLMQGKGCQPTLLDSIRARRARSA